MTLLEQTVTVDEAATPARRRFQFTVRGLPAPQGSKSYKGHSKKGHAILVESSAKVAPWRQDVVASACQAIEDTPGFVPFSGPVHLIVEFYLPRPKGAAKTRRVVPDVTPDLSKLIRSTEDAMKTACVWRDDAQVVDTTTRKRYATHGDTAYGLPWELPGIGAVVTVIEVDPEDTWSDMPLDLSAHNRFRLPVLPDVLAHCPTPQRFVRDEWSEHVVIPASFTDAKARAALAKITKASAKRVADTAEGTSPGHAIAVAIEGGAHRLASVPGKPYTDLQRELMDLVDAAEEHGTEIVVIFPAEIV